MTKSEWVKALQDAADIVAEGQDGATTVLIAEAVTETMAGRAALATTQSAFRKFGMSCWPDAVHTCMAVGIEIGLEMALQRAKNKAESLKGTVN